MNGASAKSDTHTHTHTSCASERHIARLTASSCAHRARGARHTHRSPLTGHELFFQKVKTLAIMGGDYPEGRECNLCGDRGAAAFIFETLAMPPPSRSVLRVVYVGLQIGLPVLTGARLTHCAVRDARTAFVHYSPIAALSQRGTPLPLAMALTQGLPASAARARVQPAKESPIRAAYIDYLEGPDRNRPSWDQLTALVAVRGVDGVDGLSECHDCVGINQARPRTPTWRQEMCPRFGAHRCA